jgi:hypothetical protein
VIVFLRIGIAIFFVSPLMGCHTPPPAQNQLIPFANVHLEYVRNEGDAPKSIPLDLSIDPLGNFSDIDGHILDDNALVRTIGTINAHSDEIAIGIRIQEGFETTLTTVQLARAITRITNATSSVGANALKKLRIDVFIPDFEKHG